MLDLKLDREGIAPKDAATVILVRDARGADGENTVEVFCVERSKQSRFLGGAIVFPGGKLDPSDASEEWTALSTSTVAIDAARGLVPFTSSPAHLRSITVAACRETLEEAAMLHLKGAGATDVTQEHLFALRTTLTTDPNALRTFLAEHALLLDLEALHPLARWVTPEAESRRYDTRFFVAVAPAGQTGAHDEKETMASFWATPSEVLRRWETGEVQVAPPTHCTFALLATCTTTADILALAARSCLDPICPRLVRQQLPASADSGGGGGPSETLALALPGDPEHEVRETRAFGPSRYVLRGDRWQAENAPERS